MYIVKKIDYNITNNAFCYPMRIPQAYMPEIIIFGMHARVILVG